MAHPLTEKIRPHVIAIKAQASLNDGASLNVIMTYEQVLRNPSQITIMFCDMAITSWINEHTR